MAGYLHNEDGTNKTASKSREESYAALREAYKNGSITDDDLKELAKEKNVDADSILTYLNMSNLDREKGIYNKEELPFYKSDLSKIHSSDVKSTESTNTNHHTDVNPTLCFCIVGS